MFRLDSLDLLKCYLYVSEAKNMGGVGVAEAFDQMKLVDQ